MKKLAVLLFLSSLGAAQAGTLYSYSQTASFSSSNFGLNRVVNGGAPDIGYTYSTSTNFDHKPPSTHQVLTYAKTHPYNQNRRYRIRRWDDPRIPFEVQNDIYQKKCLALGYFYKPGEKVCIVGAPGAR